MDRNSGGRRYIGDLGKKLPRVGNTDVSVPARPSRNGVLGPRGRRRYIGDLDLNLAVRSPPVRGVSQTGRDTYQI